MLQNFLAHMVYHMNVELNLDTFDDATKELYMNFIDYLPIPKSLRDIDIRSSQSVPHVYLNFQHFPNFENVFMFFDSTLTDDIVRDLPGRGKSKNDCIYIYIYIYIYIIYCFSVYQFYVYYIYSPEHSKSVSSSAVKWREVCVKINISLSNALLNVLLPVQHRTLYGDHRIL